MLGRLQHQPAGRSARRRVGGRGRGRRPEEDAADVRPVPRRQGKGGQGQQPRQGRSCKAGPTASGSPAGRKCPRASRSAFSRSPAKSIPMTCLRRPTRGAVPTFRCTRWRCTRTRVLASRPEQDGKRGPVKFIEDLRARGNLVAYVGDVVGTGSSRKSATNSVLVVHRRGHPVRAQQAIRRCLPGWQDRSDFLQHDGRLGRVADRARCQPDGTWATWSSCVRTTARRSRMAR